MEKNPEISVNTVNENVNKVLNNWRFLFTKSVLFLFSFYWLGQGLWIVQDIDHYITFGGWLYIIFARLRFHIEGPKGWSGFPENPLREHGAEALRAAGDAANDAYTFRVSFSLSFSVPLLPSSWFGEWSCSRCSVFCILQRWRQTCPSKSEIELTA